MITFFSSPRPFRGHFDAIQRNAILSWKSVMPKCEIILFEDEEGTTKKVAEEFGTRYISNIACNEFGTPLLSDLIDKAQKFAQGEILAYINTDIILLSDFAEILKKVKEQWENSFLIVGRRWDLNITEPINFKEADWAEKMKERLFRSGKLHGFSGMDYYISPRHIQFNHPPFVNGRFTADGWLVWRAKSMGIPVIDATEIITIIHQNHHAPQKEKNCYETERKRSVQLAGGFSHILTLRDADWILTANGFRKPEFPRRIFSELSLFPPWALLLALKRKLQYLI